MTLSLQYVSQLRVTEVLEANVGDLSDKTVVHSLDDTTATATGASSPPVTKVARFEQAMSGGVADIDMQALVGTANQTVVGTGLRAQFVKFKNPATNANEITVKEKASNGYDGFSTAADPFALTLGPGGEALFRLADHGSDIGGTKRYLSLVGTLAQVLIVEIVLG